LSDETAKHRLLQVFDVQDQGLGLDQSQGEHKDDSHPFPESGLGYVSVGVVCVLRKGSGDHQQHWKSFVVWVKIFLFDKRQQLRRHRRSHTLLGLVTTSHQHCQ
jgi:hypothetical protein